MIKIKNFPLLTDEEATTFIEAMYGYADVSTALQNLRQEMFIKYIHDRLSPGLIIDGKEMKPLPPEMKAMFDDFCDNLEKIQNTLGNYAQRMSVLYMNKEKKNIFDALEHDYQKRSEEITKVREEQSL
jgi:hypothetical protein